MERKEPERYSTVAALLHWVIALGIITNLISGYVLNSLPVAMRGGIFAIHLSTGMSILAFTVLRVVWRLSHRPPSFLDGPQWEARLAKVVHFCLYAAMVVMPLSGWALVSANPPAGSAGARFVAERTSKSLLPGEPTPRVRTSQTLLVWWVIPMPPVTPLADMGSIPSGIQRQHALHERLDKLHELSSYILSLLLLLHIGGVIKHQRFDKQPIMRRMAVPAIMRVFNILMRRSKPSQAGQKMLD